MSSYISKNIEDTEKLSSEDCMDLKRDIKLIFEKINFSRTYEGHG